MRSLLIAFITILSFNVWAAGNGEVRQQRTEQQAWHEASGQWLSLDEFWARYANSRDGKNWPSSAIYPEYDDVNEGDTFLVQLKGSTCLMEFFHSRWRLANDVRRWDPAFNAYGACPFVFD